MTKLNKVLITIIAIMAVLSIASVSRILALTEAVDKQTMKIEYLEDLSEYWHNWFTLERERHDDAEQELEEARELLVSTRAQAESRYIEDGSEDGHYEKQSDNEYEKEKEFNSQKNNFWNR